MIADRMTRLDPAVRNRLFATATEAFLRQGYEGASLNAILAGAGMGKSSFFYYFVDKEDLFASILEAALARVAQALGAIELPNEPARFWQDAVVVIARWGAAADAEPGFIGLTRAFQPLRRTASPRLLQVMETTRKVYRPLLERGVALGALRSDLSVDTMIALIDAVDLVLDDELQRNPVPDAKAIETHRARVMDAIRRLISA
jgi:AcrR family transcriptional regulator